MSNEYVAHSSLITFHSSLVLNRLALPLVLVQRRGLDGGGRPFRRFYQPARGVLLSQFQKPLLASNQGLASVHSDSPKTAVRQQFASLHVVRQTSGQDFIDEPVFQVRLLDGKDHFDSPAQVPIHPISRADVHLRIAGVAEIENAAVFQKAVDDGYHADVVAEPRQTRAKRADAAADQVNLHAGSASSVQ